MRRAVSPSLNCDSATAEDCAEEPRAKKIHRDAHGTDGNEASSPPVPLPLCQRLFAANLSRDLSIESLRAVLEPAGWSYAPSGEVDLLVADRHDDDDDDDCVAVHAACSSPLTNTAAVCGKFALHSLMNLHDYRAVTAESVLVSGRIPPPLPRPGVWVLRPEGACDGQGIAMVTTQAQLETAWRAWLHIEASRGGRPKQRGILSAYVTQPALLPGGYKFHVRLYAIVVRGPASHTRLGLLRRGQIVRASAPYVDDDFSNPAIHRSHMWNGATMQFPPERPEDFSGSQTAEDFFQRAAFRITRVCTLARSVKNTGKGGAEAGDVSLMGEFKPPRGSDTGFAILACDFLSDTLGRVTLLKISARPRYLPSQSTQTVKNELSDVLFAGVAHFVLNPTVENSAHVVELARLPYIAPLCPSMPSPPPAPQRRYLPAIEWLDRGALHAALTAQDSGWRPVSLADALASPVDLIVVDGRWSTDRRLYGVRARIKGRLDAPWLDSKVELQRLMGARHADMMAPAVIVEATATHAPLLPGPGVWVWRPHGGFGGKGVAFVKNQAELDAAFADRRVGKSVVLSLYISNLLLMPGGFKFHVRLHLLVAAGPSGKRAAVYKHGEIIRAALPFVEDHFDNPLIHDSHMKKNLPKAFPRDFPGGEAKAAAFFARACEILGTACKEAFPRIEWYAENEMGFELFGTDIMVDDAGGVFLLEINSKPQLSHPHGTQAWVDTLSQMICGGLAEFVLVTPALGANLSHVVEVARSVPSPLPSV